MQNMIIAVIDDDALDRRICSRLINVTSIEIKVLEFSNGQDALRYYYENADLSHNLPDMVIVDIKMPVMNGWQYLEGYEIMETRLVKKPVHYICTSSVDPQDLNCRKDIVRGVFTKPFKQENVQLMIEENSFRSSES